jgi:flagellar protein FlaH
MGYSVCYVTPELDLMGFLTQMDSLGYEIEDHILSLRLGFVCFSPKLGERYVEKLLNADRVWKGQIIILDAFDQILRNDEKFETLFRQDKEEDISAYIMTFFRNVIRKGKCIVLTIDPTNLSDYALSPFRSAADVYLQLKTIDVGSETRKLIEVKRFSSMGKQVGDVIGFSVRADIGILIEARTIV